MSDIQEEIKLAHKRAEENDIKLLQEEIKDLKCLGALGNLQSFAIDGTKGSKIVDINVNIVKNYIINLQEELEYQKQAENEYNEKHLKLMNMYSDLKSRIDKAIQFIDNKEYYVTVHYDNGEEDRKQELLDILKGDNK